jgi:hypothetical protein
VIPPFLLSLMQREKIPMHWRVQPEERICIEFSDRMRELTLKGLYHGIWGHIPNEGKRHKVVAIVMKAMGMIPGSPDHYFIKQDRGMVIEFKVKGNSLRDNQKNMKQWCEMNSIPHSVCFSADEGIAALVEYGMLDVEDHG